MREREFQKIAFDFLKGLEREGKLLAYAIPNEGSRRRKGSSFVGMKDGMADMGICLKGGKTLYFENKVKGNGLSKAQENVEHQLDQLGHHYYVMTFESEYEVVPKFSGILSAHGVEV